jgi:hypothetical protein
VEEAEEIYSTNFVKKEVNAKRREEDYHNEIPETTQIIFIHFIDYQ